MHGLAHWCVFWHAWACMEGVAAWHAWALRVGPLRACKALCARGLRTVHFLHARLLARFACVHTWTAASRAFLNSRLFRGLLSLPNSAMQRPSEPAGLPPLRAYASLRNRIFSRNLRGAAIIRRAAIIMERARGDECGRSPGWGQRGRACSRLRRPNRRGAQNYHARMEVAYMHDGAGKRALTCARMHAMRAGADQLAPGCGCNAATRGRVPRRPGRCHQPQGGGDGPGSAGSCPECRAQLSAQARVHGRAPSWESTDTGMACIG